MSLENVRAYIRTISRNFSLANEIKIVWHSGEPLVLGPKYYVDAIDIITSELKEKLVTFEFQTNGTLLDRSWADLIRSNSVHFGISLDGPQQAHDKNRKRRGGSGTFDQAVRGLEVLKEFGASFSVICVVDEEFLDRPELYEEFFSSVGVDQVSFNIPNAEGINRYTFSPEVNRDGKLEHFYRYFVERQLSGSSKVGIYQIQDIVQKILSDRKFVFEEHLPFAILTVNADGNISTFSPELAGYTHPSLGDFAFGNLNSFVIDHDKVSAMTAEIATGIKLCEQSCEYFEVCGGGLPSPKFFDCGSFDVADHVTCLNSVKTLADASAKEILRRARAT